MDSRMQTEEYESSGAFEAIKVLGRELQFAKEKIKGLEAALEDLKRAQGSADPEVQGELLERAVNAETLAKKAQEDLEAVSVERDKYKANLESLREQNIQLKSMKQEQHDVKASIILSEGRELSDMTAKLDQEAAATRELAAKLVINERELVQVSIERDRLATEKGALADTLHQVQVAEQAWSIEQYVALAEDHQRVMNRPDYISLQPVCSSAMDLQKYIEADRDFRWMSNNFLCLPEPTRILWTSTSCQIGLAFGPMFQYKPPGPGLVKHSEFTGIYGKKLEVFFKSEDEIYYAGTYLCQGLKGKNPQGCLRSDAQSANALADMTFPADAAYPDTTGDSLRSIARCLYAEGVFKAECVILRCVGFNHRVHDTFSKRYTILNTLPNTGGSSSSHQVSGSPGLPGFQRPQSGKCTSGRSGPAPRKRSRGD